MWDFYRLNLWRSRYVPVLTYTYFAFESALIWKASLYIWRGNSSIIFIPLFEYFMSSRTWIKHDFACFATIIPSSCISWCFRVYICYRLTTVSITIFIKKWAFFDFIFNFNFTLKLRDYINFCSLTYSFVIC